MFDRKFGMHRHHLFCMVVSLVAQAHEGFARRHQSMRFRLIAHLLKGLHGLGILA